MGGGYTHGKMQNVCARFSPPVLSNTLGNKVAERKKPKLAVKITYSPAPDSRERLRRVIALLLRRGDIKMPGKDQKGDGT